MRKFQATLAGLLFVAGCTGTIDIQPVAVKEPLVIPEGSDPKPVLLTRLRFQQMRGQDLGKRFGGSLCKERGRIYSDSDYLDLRGLQQDLGAAFREAMIQANYPVVGDPNALFEDDSASKAELKLAGSVDKLALEPCYYYDNKNNYNYASGAASLRINWQVYDVLARRVVYQTSTEGFFFLNEVKRNGASVLVINAFQAAVRNLLADPGFNALVTRRQPAATDAAAGYSPIDIVAGKTPPSDITSAAASVVTILNATGLGSGFIISPDGYVLTDRHVVGQSRLVNVRLSSGREMTGEVVRTDAVRDVALVKLEESNLPALRLRTESTPAIADEVYAIGTPLHEELHNTVTRGVVGGYRMVDGFSFIQSDVSIHHGNSGGPLLDRSGAVVGLCEMGLFQGDPDGSIHLFTPIADALKQLNIRLVTFEASVHMQ